MQEVVNHEPELVYRSKANREQAYFNIRAGDQGVLKEVLSVLSWYIPSIRPARDRIVSAETRNPLLGLHL